MNAGHMKVGPVCYDDDEEQRNLGGICNSPRLMANTSLAGNLYVGVLCGVSAIYFLFPFPGEV